jgi:trans-2-enoyl-CoA reductase
LTKLLEMAKHGIDVSKDVVLQSMLQPTSVEKIEEVLEQEVMHHR